jgi:hypothetical protein
MQAAATLWRHVSVSVHSCKKSILTGDNGENGDKDVSTRTLNESSSNPPDPVSVFSVSSCSKNVLTGAMEITEIRADFGINGLRRKNGPRN